LFVDANGNVSIGTTTNVNNRRLIVNGVIGIANAGTERGKWYDDGSISYLDSSGSWAIYAGGSERMRLTSAGLLGLGTSSPAARFDVVSADNTAATTIVSVAANNQTSAIQLGYNRITQVNSTPASAYLELGVSNNTTAVHIDGTGRVGIGTTGPQHKLQVSGGSLCVNGFADSANAYISLREGFSPSDAGGVGFRAIDHSGANADGLGCYGQDGISFYTSASERARIDSSGRLLVGTSSVYSGIPGQLLNTATAGVGTYAGLAITTYSASTGIGAGCVITLDKSNSNTLGTNTAVTNNDQLGTIAFRGADGGSSFRDAAYIQCFVDGTVSGGGAADMPGRLVFSTTADGASSPTERMRITNAGLVGLGTSSPGTILDVRFGTSPITDNGSGLNALRCFTTSALAVNTGGAIALGGVYHNNGDVAAFGQIAGRKENSTSNDLSGYLQFATNTGGGTMIERARIDSAGRLLVGVAPANSNGGVLQLSSGITFPASAYSSTDPNTLDDYEEGTWTPAVPGTSMTYNAQTGVYTKVGNLVYIRGYVNISGGTPSGGTGGGTIITGLPFTSESTQYHTLTTSANGGNFGGAVPIAQVNPGGTAITAIGVTNNAAFADSVPTDVWDAANNWVQVTGCYRVP
jgi:hypothetical protein